MSTSVPLNPQFYRPAYKHQKLQGRDTIRVIILSPKGDLTPHEELHCDLVEYRLSEETSYFPDNPPDHGYITLSYVWGDLPSSRSIYIGEFQMDVGANLYSALQHLRRKDRTVYIWADAICINQKDSEERNHQVQKMRQIYSSAEETIIYLGDLDGGNTTITAWNYLERHSAWGMNENLDVDETRPITLNALKNWRGDLEDVEIDVLRRAWFRRVWVFPEVVVSRKLSIQCGNRRIDWDDFCKFCS